MHNPRSVLENETHRLLWDLEIQTDHLISTKRPDYIIINKKLKKEKEKGKEKERTCLIVDFAVPADHRVKPKEIENKNKYLNLANDLKKVLNMKVTLIPIIIGILGIVTKGLVQGLEDLEIRGRLETIENTALLRSARILRRVLETWRHLLSLQLQWETINKRWCEKLEKG